VPDTKREDVRLTKSGRKSHEKIPGAKRGRPSDPNKLRNGGKSKRAPSADTKLLIKPTSDEDVKTVLLFMREHGISLRSSCRQLQFHYNMVVERVVASPELRALDSEVRCNYMREKVRMMEVIVHTEPDVQRARLMCDNIKWEAARIMRTEFGDHVVLSSDPNAPLIMKLVSDSNDLVDKIRSGRTTEHDPDEAIPTTH